MADGDIGTYPRFVVDYGFSALLGSCSFCQIDPNDRTSVPVASIQITGHSFRVCLEHATMLQAALDHCDHSIESFKIWAEGLPP